MGNIIVLMLNIIAHTVTNEIGRMLLTILFYAIFVCSGLLFFEFPLLEAFLLTIVIVFWTLVIPFMIGTEVYFKRNVY